jgi:hypothetical protein
MVGIESIARRIQGIFRCTVVHDGKEEVSQQTRLLCQYKLNGIQLIATERSQVVDSWLFVNHRFR